MSPSCSDRMLLGHARGSEPLSCDDQWMIRDGFYQVDIGAVSHVVTASSRMTRLLLTVLAPRFVIRMSGLPIGSASEVACAVKSVDEELCCAVASMGFQ